VGGGEARLWGCHRSHGWWAWPEGAGVGEGESSEQDQRVTDGAGVIVETEVEEGRQAAESRGGRSGCTINCSCFRSHDKVTQFRSG
jgi:hypothetical protein